MKLKRESLLCSLEVFLAEYISQYGFSNIATLQMYLDWLDKNPENTFQNWEPKSLSGLEKYGSTDCIGAYLFFLKHCSKVIDDLGECGYRLLTVVSPNNKAVAGLFPNDIPYRHIAYVIEDTLTNISYLFDPGLALPVLIPISESELNLTQVEIADNIYTINPVDDSLTLVVTKANGKKIVLDLLFIDEVSNPEMLIKKPLLQITTKFKTEVFSRKGEKIAFLKLNFFEEEISLGYLQEKVTVSFELNPIIMRESVFLKVAQQLGTSSQELYQTLQRLIANKNRVIDMWKPELQTEYYQRFAKEKAISGRITIIFESGVKKINTHQTKVLREVIANDEEYNVVFANNENRPDLSKYDPASTLVFATTSRMDFDFYESQGFQVYPKSEMLSTVSDKWILYEKCRKLGIPTVLTFLLPKHAYEQVSTQAKVTTLTESVGGGIVKPRNTFGEIRGVVDQVYMDAVKDYDKFVIDGVPLDVEYVLQRKIDKPAMKVFGVWPDQFFYLDENDEIYECPPNIKRTCKLLCEEFDVNWGGFDFIVDENNVWRMIDINPPSGGRTLSESSRKKVHLSMRASIDRLMTGEYLSRNQQDIKIIVAAAGQGSRLAEETQGLPKSLLVVDGDKTVLDYSTDSAKALGHYPGFDPKILLMTKPEDHDDFSHWISNSQNEDSVELVHPDDNLFKSASSYNHVLASLPENSDLAMILAADRISFLSVVQQEQLTQSVREALQEDEVPYVVVGFIDPDSKHRYITDQNGTILEYHREKDNPHTGVGVKKIAFAFNAAKTTVTSAKNTYEVVTSQMAAGSLGRLILLDGNVDKAFDVDTPEDLQYARNQFTATQQ